MRRLAVIAIFVAIGFGAGGARPQAAQSAAPVAQPQGPVSTAPAGPISPSTCEADSLAWLVGHPRSDIPVPVEPSHRRVSCSTCPVTMDYQPGRTDIIYDDKTGLITQVKCG